MTMASTVIAAQPGWHRVIVRHRGQGRFAIGPLRPIIGWAIRRHEGAYGITPGEATYSNAATACDEDRWEDFPSTFVAHVTPDGRWITATGVFASEADLLATLSAQWRVSAKKTEPHA
jgi:hypothetical protein